MLSRIWGAVTRALRTYWEDTKRPMTDEEWIDNQW